MSFQEYWKSITVHLYQCLKTKIRIKIAFVSSPLKDDILSIESCFITFAGIKSFL